MTKYVVIMWFRSDVLKVMSNFLIIFLEGSVLNFLPNINAKFVKLKNIYDTQEVYTWQCCQMVYNVLYSLLNKCDYLINTGTIYLTTPLCCRY